MHSTAPPLQRIAAHPRAPAPNTLMCLPTADTGGGLQQLLGGSEHVLGITPQRLRQQLMPSRKAAQVGEQGGRRSHR